MIILIPSVEQVIETNEYICQQSGNLHQVLDKGKIESALHSAFYPGSYPFEAGGIAKIAGVLCFYLVKAHAFMDGNKRVGSLTAIIFMNENGWDLKYPEKEKNGNTGLANIILKCASGKIDKEEMMDWFENHKIKLS